MSNLSLDDFDDMLHHGDVIHHNDPGAADKATPVLGAADFGAYFLAVHGYKPYGWQQRLTEQVIGDGRWPDVIDLPTGTGKTAVLDTAIFALAVNPKVFPRRVVFVIDRRIVVDAVYERAANIQKSIMEASHGILDMVKQSLSRITDAEPLGVAALRGGIPIDAEWARRPDQPWVIVSTVDQFGSRLLFRGYGTSPRMRPVHAGLAGNDCLIILDEVHLSVPFAQTVKDFTSDGDIPLIQSVNKKLLPRRRQFVEMSATPSREVDVPFRLEQADIDGSTDESIRLAKIAQACKQAILQPIGGTKPAHLSVPREVWNLLRRDLRPHEKSVGVIVNRVRTARETHRLLQAKGIRSFLVTGRMRPIDRERALNHIEQAVNPDRKSPLAERTVIVATQAIEVGADFSFDALITEAAPVDSIRQRLGRLDRRGVLAAGRGQPARCWIMGVQSAMNPKKPDPVYGDAMRITWEWLDGLPEITSDDEIDVGPESEIWQGAPPTAQAPRSDAPLVLQSHVNAWVQTNPEPIVQPSIAEFLHGKDQAREPDVSLVWRWDRSFEALNLVRPRPAEFLSVPISAARRWLDGGKEVPVADIDSPSLDDSKPTRSIVSEPRLRYVARWTGHGERSVESLKSVQQIKPGDVIVVDPSLGGITDGTWDPFLTDPVSASTGRPSDSDINLEDDGSASPDSDTHKNFTYDVEDLGDAAQHAYGARRTLRLDPRLFDALTGVPTPPQPYEEENAEQPFAERIIDWFKSLAGSSSAAEGTENYENSASPSADAPAQSMRGQKSLFDDSSDVAGPDVGATSQSVDSPQEDEPADADASMKLPRWMQEVVNHFARLRPSEYRRELIDDKRNPNHSYYVLTERTLDPAMMDGSDEASSATGAAVTLSSHLKGVGAEAARFAELLGLSSELVTDLRLAGELHDLGKVDTRFQDQMVGHDPVQQALQDEPLAKSLPRARTRPEAWPPLRHELGSAVLIGSAPEIRARACDPDLVLHLVSTHHGQARPLPPIVKDDTPQILEATHDGITMRASSEQTDTGLALEMADRFWRMHEKYGHHGLAWLEAIFRLADHHRSAEEAKGINAQTDAPVSAKAVAA